MDAKAASKQLTRLRVVKQELAQVTARRTALWQEHTEATAPKAALEVAWLSERIEALWSEARQLAAEIRSGPRAEIITRARAAERVERDLGRRLRTEPARTGR
jgi:ATP-dependent Clp protease ATP-binding subunit ClpA